MTKKIPKRRGVRIQRTLQMQVERENRIHEEGRKGFAEIVLDQMKVQAQNEPPESLDKEVLP